MEPWIKIQEKYLSWLKGNWTAYTGNFGRDSFRGWKMSRTIGVNDIDTNVATDTYMFPVSREKIYKFIHLITFFALADINSRI